MRDLQRKVNKFVKERASVKIQKSRGVSPGLNNTLSPNATIGFNSTAQSFTRITRKVNNRTFSMTVSFNPRFDVPPARDVAIYHQDRKQKNLVANPVDHNKSPKYNPILQNGQEPCFEFKPSFKATPLTGKMTIFDDEPVIKKRAGGEYKEAIQNARSLSPKGPCIKTYYAPALREEQSPEKQRRVRKGVANSLKNLFNPITEGDIQNLKFRRARKGAESTKPSEETLKLNARNKLLPTEIGFSPKGRVFRDSSLVLSAHPIEDAAPAKGKRFASPQQKRKPDMQGLLEYSFSLPYRDQTVSPKCTSQSFYEVVKNMGSNKE